MLSRNFSSHFRHACAKTFVNRDQYNTELHFSGMQPADFTLARPGLQPQAGRETGGSQTH